jgi:hypothetical protein
MVEKVKQDYLLLIMNCQMYRNKAIQQKNSWLQTLPDYIAYYHVMGDPTLDSPFVFNNEERILWVKTQDDYISLPKKVIAALFAVRETVSFKYIFKTDDDQTLDNVETFFNMVLQQIKEKAKMKPHYGGQIVDVQIPYLSQYFTIHPELPQDMIIHKTEYCSGRFYFLSTEAVTNLVSKRKKIEDEYLEDYAIGLHLNPILKKVMIHIQSDQYLYDAV